MEYLLQILLKQASVSKLQIQQNMVSAVLHFAIFFISTTDSSEEERSPVGQQFNRALNPALPCVLLGTILSQINIIKYSTVEMPLFHSQCHSFTKLRMLSIPASYSSHQCYYTNELFYEYHICSSTTGLNIHGSQDILSIPFPSTL